MCNYGSLHLRINEILAEKGISKTKSVKIWTFLAVTSTDTAEMNSREWTQT